MNYKTQDITPLLERYGIEPHNYHLYQMAFTHSSCNGLYGNSHDDYERLEFLGDSVVGMVVSELCFIYHPEMDQGSLSVLKAQFIRTESESAYALKLGFAGYIRVGVSYKEPIERSYSVLEDVFESFIGAVYLDQGVLFAYKMVRSFFEEDIKNGHIIKEENPKSELQEAMQADHKESVHYKILLEEGPAHAKHFISAVYFEETEMGRGEGHNKKEAETAAARDALKKLALNKTKEGA
jgi:ribonuclease-3